LLAILCSVVVAYPHAAGVVRGLDEMGESKEDFASIRARLATEMKASHAVLDDQDAIHQPAVGQQLLNAPSTKKEPVDSHIEKASIKAPVKIQKAEPIKKVAPVPKEAAYSVPEENGGFVSSSQKTAKNVEKKIEKKQTLKDPKQVQKELAAGFAALSPAPSKAGYSVEAPDGGYKSLDQKKVKQEVEKLVEKDTSEAVPDAIVKAEKEAEKDIGDQMDVWKTELEAKASQSELLDSNLEDDLDPSSNLEKSVDESSEKASSHQGGIKREGSSTGIKREGSSTAAHEEEAEEREKPTELSVNMVKDMFAKLEHPAQVKAPTQLKAPAPKAKIIKKKKAELGERAPLPDAPALMGERGELLEDIKGLQERAEVPYASPSIAIELQSKRNRVATIDKKLGIRVIW